MTHDFPAQRVKPSPGRALRVLGAVLAVGASWEVLSRWAGSELVPGPVLTARAAARIFSSLEAWGDLTTTLARGALGLAGATLSAFAAGIPCGLSRRAMDAIAPVVAAIQGCPAIVWIALLLVWTGAGPVVPLVAIWIAVFPVLFLSIAGGTAALDRRLFEMARAFRVPRGRLLTGLLLPGIVPAFLSGLSYALAVCWKVTATAEFLAASDGVGSQIYWAYRYLDMPALFAWTAAVMMLGASLESGVIRPLRRRAGERAVGKDGVAHA
jgi:NitT/TauT family transport system permease protein